MRAIELQDRDAPKPGKLPVAVILAREPARIGRWTRHTWSAVGVVAGTFPAAPAREGRVCDHDNGVEHYLVGGLALSLHPDECESYYHNLMSPRPSCYVVAHPDEADEERRPDPFLVTMSFDAAHAYLEGDDEIYAVEIPPEIYRWTEAFVLSYYAPEKRRKRKLVKGSAGARDRS